MGQKWIPLPGLVPSHLFVVAHYDWRSGWTATVTATGLGDLRARSSAYDGLSSDELLDVCCSELERHLRPSRAED